MIPETTPSPIIKDYKAKWATVENLMDEFDTIVQDDSTLNIEEFYEIFKKEVDTLTTYRDYAKERLRRIQEPGCWDPTSKAVWITGALQAAAKTLNIASAVMLAFSKQNIAFLIAGGGLYIASEAADGILSMREMYLNLRSSEEAELAQINDEQIKQAERFKKFVKEIKKIRKIVVAEQESGHMTEIRNLESHIQKCVHNYEQIASEYRKESTYARVISILIQHLPENDPLKQELQVLDSLESPTVAPELEIDQPISTEAKNDQSTSNTYTYLPQSMQNHLNNLPTNQLHGEQESHYAIQENQHIQRISPTEFRPYQHYLWKVQERFQLHLRLAFLDMPNGQRIWTNTKDMAKEERITIDPHTTTTTTTTAMQGV